ncbi:MAG: hypothetical protein M1837_000371 [Sclerophora amabilis]|nr:MAG: hypothetical protein M1837_000371 [Sclerophora amabilis]
MIEAERQILEELRDPWQLLERVSATPPPTSETLNPPLSVARRKEDRRRIDSPRDGLARLVGSLSKPGCGMQMSSPLVAKITHRRY